LQKRVLDANHLSGWRDDQVVDPRRLHDDIATLLAAGEVNLSTGEGGAKKLGIGDANPDDLPEGLSMQTLRSSRERQNDRQDYDNRQRSQPTLVPRHVMFQHLEFVVKPSIEAVIC
jgi:hypothetical protein